MFFRSVISRRSPGYLGDPSFGLAFESYAVNIRPTISAFLLDIDSNLVVNRFVSPLDHTLQGFFEAVRIFRMDQFQISSDRQAVAQECILVRRRDDAGLNVVIPLDDAARFDRQIRFEVVGFQLFFRFERFGDVLPGSDDFPGPSVRIAFEGFGGDLRPLLLSGGLLEQENGVDRLRRAVDQVPDRFEERGPAVVGHQHLHGFLQRIPVSVQYRFIARRGKFVVLDVVRPRRNARGVECQLQLEPVLLFFLLLLDFVADVPFGSDDPHDASRTG